MEAKKKLTLAKIIETLTVFGAIAGFLIMAGEKMENGQIVVEDPWQLFLRILLGGTILIVFSFLTKKAHNYQKNLKIGL